MNKDIASEDFVYTHLHVMTLSFFTAAAILYKLLHAPFLLGEGDTLQLLANIVSKYILIFFLDIYLLLIINWFTSILFLLRLP